MQGAGQPVATINKIERFTGKVSLVNVNVTYIELYVTVYWFFFLAAERE